MVLKIMKTSRKITGILIVVGIILWSILVACHKEFISNFTLLNYFTLFIGCIMANSGVFLPAPGLVLVTSATIIMNPLYVILLSATGFCIGESVGYFSGYTGRQIFKEKDDDGFRRMFDQKGNIIIYIFSVLPLPLFDCVGVYAGYIKYNYRDFIIFCFLGKLTKVTVWVLGTCYFMDFINI